VVALCPLLGAERKTYARIELFQNRWPRGRDSHPRLRLDSIPRNLHDLPVGRLDPGISVIRGHLIANVATRIAVASSSVKPSSRCFFFFLSVSPVTTLTRANFWTSQGSSLEHLCRVTELRYLSQFYLL
jgi:hypothetical protein